jgi:hypothetical protein
MQPVTGDGFLFRYLGGRNQRGQTLTSNLIALAIIGAMVMGVSTAVSQFMKSAAVAREWTSISDQINIAAHIFQTPELCDLALRDSSGNPVNLNLTVTPSISIGRIYMHSALPFGPSAIALQTNNNNGSEVTLASIAVTKQAPAAAPYQISTRTPSYNTTVPTPGAATTYNVFPAFVTLNFTQNGNPISPVPAQSIPLVIAVQTGAPTNYRCYSNVLNQQVCEANGGYIDNSARCVGTAYENTTNYGKSNFVCSSCTLGAANCKAGACNGASPCITNGPIRQWVMTGFDSTGQPQCLCQWFCM